MPTQIQQALLVAEGQRVEIYQALLEATASIPSDNVRLYEASLEADTPAAQAVQIYEAELVAAGNPPQLVSVTVSDDNVFPGTIVTLTAVTTGTVTDVTFTAGAASLPINISKTGVATATFSAPYDPDGGPVFVDVFAVNDDGVSNGMQVTILVSPHLDWYPGTDGLWHPLNPRDV